MLLFQGHIYVKNMTVQMDRAMFPQNVTDGDYVFQGIIYRKNSKLAEADLLFDLKMPFSIETRAIV